MSIGLSDKKKQDKKERKWTYWDIFFQQYHHYQIENRENLFELLNGW